LTGEFIHGFLPERRATVSQGSFFYPQMPGKFQAHPGDLTAEEMRAHMAQGRSILISPKYSYGAPGEPMKMVGQGAHLVHPSQIEGIAELTSMDLVGDPHAEARARSEAELKQLADLETKNANAATPSPHSASQVDATVEATKKAK
jgi:hypothetical protein